MTFEFDVFLAHNSKDKDDVRRICQKLEEKGFKPWFDEQQIPPGVRYQVHIQEAIPTCKSAAVFIGPDREPGIVGRWQGNEIEVLLTESTERKFPVIPVLLPGTTGIPDNLRFLRQHHWVEFVSGLEDDEILRQLACGIQGIPPGSGINPWPSIPDDSHSYILPPAEGPDIRTITKPIYLKLVRIPAGQFKMGSARSHDKDARPDELPQDDVYLPDYYIAKYPITNAQFAAFLNETEYKTDNPAWRPGGRLNVLLETVSRWMNMELGTTRVPDQSGFQTDKSNHPATNVSWRDAVEFCLWLAEKSGQTVRLPTEAEWEKAARGSDGQIYPWGDEFDENKCNSIENSDVTGTATIGFFSPDGDSSYSVADMAGNVSEWCSSIKDDYPYDAQRDEWQADFRVQENKRVLRGGSWRNPKETVRCAARRHDDIDSAKGTYGFRVAITI